MCGGDTRGSGGGGDGHNTTNATDQVIYTFCMVLTLALLAVLLTFALVIYNVIGPSEFCKIVPSTHCTTNQLPQLPSTVVQATLREDRTSLTILSSLKVFFVENSFCRQRVGPTICEFLGSGEVFSQQIFLFYDHSTPLLRSMKQRAVIWPVVDNLIEPLPPPPPSLLPHHHQTHQTPLSLPESTFNHTPSLSSEHLPRVSLSLHPVSTAESSSSSSSSSLTPVSNNRGSHYSRAAGDHMTSHQDHVTPHSSHMTLRRREGQFGVPMVSHAVPCSLNVSQYSEQFIRSKVCRQVVVANGNCSPPSGVKRLTQLPATGSEPVLETSTTSPPARNLRFRPYTLGKT